MNRRVWLGGALGSLALAAHPGLARAAEPFNKRPVTLIVPFAPGGNIDIVARTLAPALEDALGGSVVVDNRAGGGGSIAASLVARAEPDGHTLLVTTPNAVTVLPQMMKTSYKLADFKAVGTAATTPQVIVVKGDSKYKDIAALMAAIKADPHKITVGHSGPGTTNHIAILLFQQAAQLDLNVIPYKGSGPALVDLVGGQIDFMVDQVTSSTSYLQSGQLRALAVMSRNREPNLPNVPTLREAGVRDFESSTTTGLLAPRTTPDAVVAMLNDAMHKALASSAVQKRLLEISSPAQPSTAAQWLTMLQTEESRIGELMKSGMLKPE